MMRHLVRATVQFPISQTLVAGGDRHRVGRSRGLRLEKFVNGFVLRVVGFRPVPFHQELVSFPFGQ